LISRIQQIHWPTLISGLAMGLALMQVLVARTVTTRIDHLARDIASTRHQLVALAGSADDVGRTNDLLHRLSLQRDQIKSANESLLDLRRLQSEIARESARFDASRNVLDHMGKLQSDLIAQRPKTDAAIASVTAATALQSRIQELSAGLPAQAAGIADAETVVTQLSTLKQQVLDQQPHLDIARQQLDGLALLARGLATGAEQMLEAKTAASELVAMKNMLMLESEGLDRSRNSAEQLVGLNEKLSDVPQIRIDEARNNLHAMIELQQGLSGQTRAIAENVQNLDLLVDFQSVLGEQMGNLDGLRRQLTELVLMESTIARAARTLAPLAELGNMRGLGEQELRDAARVILDRRSSRSNATRLAEGTDAVETGGAVADHGVMTVSSPDDVFEPAARPTPAPPVE
jgi:hypothetical protein